MYSTCPDDFSSRRNNTAQCVAVQCDVTEAAAVDSAVETVTQRFGQLHGAANMAGWVGNQGIHGKAYGFGVITDADWDSVVKVNLRSGRIAAHERSCVDRQRSQHCWTIWTSMEWSILCGKMGCYFHHQVCRSREWTQKHQSQCRGARGYRHALG